MSIRIPMLALIGAAVTLSGCGPLPEGASGSVYLARNMRQVVPLSQAGQFEVISQPGDAGVQFFCAAGDYADFKLGARSVDRVVLVGPVGPAVTRSGRSAVFKLVPGQTPNTPSRSGITINMRKAGENLSVAHARFLCESQSERTPF